VTDGLCAKQPHEPSLFEVVIFGQRFGKPTGFHQEETHGVAEGPFLVQSLAKQGDGSQVEFFVHVPDFK
jgi:hypothetical protein